MGGPRNHGQFRTMRRRVRRSFSVRPPQGFTVIEVLIVLGVTAFLFVAAASQISGRQNRTAFDQAIREVQSQIQQTINEVSIGYYPNLSNFQCTGSAATGPVITASASTAQGTNSGCIFLGKALQFKIHGTNPEQFATFAIAGVQQGGLNNAESASLAEAKPLAIASTNSTTLPSATEVRSLQSGLTTADMWYMSGGTKKPIGVVAFTASLAQYSGGSLQSGSEQVNLVPIDTSTIDATQLTAAGVLNSKITTSPLNPSSGVFICFASGTTTQSGLITIGSNGRQLAVTLAIKGNTTCS